MWVSTGGEKKGFWVVAYRKSNMRKNMRKIDYEEITYLYERI